MVVVYKCKKNSSIFSLHLNYFIIFIILFNLSIKNLVKEQFTKIGGILSPTLFIFRSNSKLSELFPLRIEG